MPEISPFRPYRYSLGHVPNPGEVIAPPYDVISPQKRQALLDGDPHNIIQLILPEGDEETKYPHAGDLLRDWISSGLLERERSDALYAYAQHFDHPVTGERIERRGIITLLKLSPFGEGSVLPHERTLSGPKADRLKLMEATDANLEPIFGMYPDPQGKSSARLQGVIEGDSPMLSVTDNDGVEHRLWQLTSDDMIGGFVDDLRDNKVFIVDGHHRYETALNYQRAMRQRNSARPQHDWIMIFIAPSSDPGLVILPTHRVLHGVAGFDYEGLLGKLDKHFTIEKSGSSAEGYEALGKRDSPPGYLFLSGGNVHLVRLRENADMDQLLDPALPAGLKNLDVTLLHDYIFEKLLGITQQAQSEQTNIQYLKSSAEALAAGGRTDINLVALMNPTRLEQVITVAESGTVMPQKSTFFYPKLASGLLINPLWEE